MINVDILIAATYVGSGPNHLGLKHAEVPQEALNFKFVVRFFSAISTLCSAIIHYYKKKLQNWLFLVSKTILDPSTQ